MGKEGLFLIVSTGLYLTNRKAVGSARHSSIYQ
jgi:hypothetical protein